MSPNELLNSVKKRFAPLLVREEDTLQSFLIQALGTYQDKAGVMTAKKLEKAGGTSIPLPDDYLELVHVTDHNGMLVYSSNFGQTIELELVGGERWPFRMTYLANLRDRSLDDWQVPPMAIGVISDYLFALINVQNVARRRVACIDGKFDYSDLPDEATLYQRCLDLEEKMAYNRAILPGATLVSGGFSG